MLIVFVCTVGVLESLQTCGVLLEQVFKSLEVSLESVGVYVLKRTINCRISLRPKE